MVLPQRLVRFEPELYDMMHKSIEMARLSSKNTTKPMPLFLLWKGIMHTTLRYPEHKFFVGSEY
jgi:hypothetical protein